MRRGEKILNTRVRVWHCYKKNKPRGLIKSSIYPSERMEAIGPPAWAEPEEREKEKRIKSDLWCAISISGKYGHFTHL